ncbi:MAG: UbiD family decarboxylase, partial [Anaerolineales bacterium]|nr:UbiD family decarboxylase [Anaerolineales bacterium]
MGQIRNLRDYIQILEQGGQLVRIRKWVSLQHELANVAAAVQRQGRGASLFENPQDNLWPVFAGAVGSPDLAALALECDLADVTARMAFALDPSNAIPPVPSEDPTWKANQLVGEKVDLNKIPIPTHGAHDGGPFITGGITLATDPISGRGNLSYNRMQVLGPRTLGFNVNEWRHVMQFYKVKEAQDEPLEIAIAIGVDPAISIAAGARYDEDELCIAGAIRGVGVNVSKGVT